MNTAAANYLLLVLSLALIFTTPSPCISIPAFPGAEGFGSETVHGRGKQVFKVTRLDDLDMGQKTVYFENNDKVGCFRWALAAAEENGGGTIIFDVAGTIDLIRDAHIPSNTYVAGQSAPGTGIAIEGGAVVIKGRDVLVRNMRYRGNAPRGADAFRVDPEAENVILDHLSISFFRDGAVDIVGAKNVTIQWTHMGDAVDSLTSEPYHCEPNLIRTEADRISIHHNYYTHTHSRTPLFHSSNATNGLIEFSNNILYNYRKYPSQFSAPNGRGNGVGNFYVPGSFTHGDDNSPRNAMNGSDNFTIHVRDNIALSSLPGFPGHDDAGCPGSDQDTCRGNDQNVTGCRPESSRPETDIMGVSGTLGPRPGVFNYSSTRFSEIPAITYHPVAENVDTVLSTFGALPRDNTDRRLLNEIRTHTGEWKLTIPDDQNNYSGTPQADQDNDGMPDEWEQDNGGDLHANGHDLHPTYDNLEVYLHQRLEELIENEPLVNAYEDITGICREDWVCSWSDWSICTGGSQTRTETCTDQNNCGAPDTTATEHRECTQPADINGDGTVDTMDVILALQVASGQSPANTVLESDANSDGHIDIIEAIVALRKLKGLTTD